MALVVVGLGGCPDDGGGGDVVADAADTAAADTATADTAAADTATACGPDPFGAVSAGGPLHEVGPGDGVDAWLCTTGDSADEDWFGLACDGRPVTVTLTPVAGVAGLALRVEAPGESAPIAAAVAIDGAASVGVGCPANTVWRLRVALAPGAPAVPEGALGYRLGVATAACVNDGDCGDGAVCDGYACVAGCRTHAACAAGERCVLPAVGPGGGGCAPGCDDNRGCGAGHCDKRTFQCDPATSPAVCASDDAFDTAASNGTPAAATTLAGSVTESLRLCCSDEDWFLLTLDSGSWDVDVTVTAPDRFPTVAIFDSGGRAVGRSAPLASPAVASAPRLGPASYHVAVLPNDFDRTEGEGACALGTFDYVLNVALTAATPCGSAADCAVTAPRRGVCQAGACAFIDGAWTVPAGATCGDGGDCQTNHCLVLADRSACTLPCSGDAECAPLGAEWGCLDPGGLCGPR